MSFRWVMLLTCSIALAAPAAAESWDSVFAAEQDTFVFLGGDGSLIRAPFSLATRETLWRASANQHVVRFAAAPSGRRVAWITRDFDRDTTRLWIADAARAERRLRYFALLPAEHGQRRFEADVPTVTEAGPRAARLARAGTLSLRAAANTLAWTADGRGVVVGYDGGIVRVAADSRARSGVAGVLAASLEALSPSPMLLADVLALSPLEDLPRVTELDLGYLTEHEIVVREGRRLGAAALSRVVLSPTPSGWRMCQLPEWTVERPRAVGARTLWWARGRTVYALRDRDSLPARVVEGPEDVAWLGYDASRGDLLGLAGRELWRRPEAGGEPRVVATLASEARDVFASRTTPSIAVVTRDSLLLWNPATDRLRGYATGGLVPCAMFESPDGRVVVQAGCGGGRSGQLARVDEAAGRLVPIATPRVRHAAVQPAGHGAWILVGAAGSTPPRSLEVYDVRADRWHTVENPGISAWEPLE